jgi:hypothetical protein
LYLLGEGLWHPGVRILSGMCVSQGFGIGRYDILFATNVLHATRNMGKTLQQCKTLLRNGGLLIANELSAKTPFLSLTFGLTEGWWVYDDESRRIPGRHLHQNFLQYQCVPPVRSPASWQLLLIV